MAVLGLSKIGGASHPLKIRANLLEYFIEVYFVVSYFIK